MIPDCHTNIVYFSDLLPRRDPGLWGQLADVLSTNGIEYRLLAGTKDIWCRDYLPVQVGDGDYVLFRYQPDYLRDDGKLVTPDEVRKAVAPAESLRTSDINLDGGNVVASSTKVILTEKVYKENRGHAPRALRKELAAVLRADCIFIPREPYDVIGHADGVVRFLDEDTVVVNDYQEIEPAYGDRLEAALGLHGLVIERLPYFRTQEAHDGIPSAVGNYVNFLRVGGLVVVPAYGVPQDDLACRTLEGLLPGARVVPLRCKGLARKGGVLNCVGWGLHVGKMGGK